MNKTLYNCDKCGQAIVIDPDDWCGVCEEEYLSEQERISKEEMELSMSKHGGYWDHYGNWMDTSND